MDIRLFEVSALYQVRYSRYADDLTFSGNYITSAFSTIKIITEEKFEYNHRKEILVGQIGLRMQFRLFKSDLSFPLPS